MHLLLQCSGSSRQNREGFVVHGNDSLAVEKKLPIRRKYELDVVHRIRRFLGSHRVMVANTEKTHVRNVQIVDHLHVAKYARVSTVIDVVI